jgi:hypothetical protein
MYRGNEHKNVRYTRRKRDVPKVDKKKLREELYDYFSDRRRRLDVVKTTRTPSGQVLDWIPIESQLTGSRKPAQPPSESMPLKRIAGGRRFKPARFELEHPDVERGPKGTVPVPRRNLKRLRPVRTLQDHLSKHGRQTYTMFINERDSVEIPRDLSSHEYGSSMQSVTCYGAEGNLSIFDPYVQRSDEFSLLQVALVREPGPKPKMQTIEAGWQKYPDLYGDWAPRFFVFFTTNGYTKSGDYIGGYNRDVDGWIQVSDKMYPEALVGPISTPGGPQYVMHIKYQLHQRNWWFGCNGLWIGYYPASMFNPSGLRSKAGKVSFYGEIVDSKKDGVSSRTDMGSGYWPQYGWPWSAYMCNLRYQSKKDGSMSRYLGQVWESNPNEYGIQPLFNSNTAWESYCWVGGPGSG